MNADNDVRKGAEERDYPSPVQGNEHNLNHQLGHRDQDEMLKDADSDFPEPGSNPEHSGQDLSSRRTARHRSSLAS
ncbi:MAG TPA: hypothetical protein VGR96_10105 [Acidobacteriaceae bacterium]|nr:hypothetical protein [Acidobacteriaceae bacterium]